MCMNCVSNGETVAAAAALVVTMAKDPLHQALADVGLVAPPSTIARDANTVAFLRHLDLDPVPVLGAEPVRAADRWVAEGGQGRRARSVASRRAWALPIGSHSRIAVP